MNRLPTLLFLLFFIFSSVVIAAAQEVVIPLGKAENYMFWQGQWAPDTSYKISDGVQYYGSSYVCVEAHQSTGTDAPPSAYWNLLAAQGDTGATGAAGAAGSQGSAGLRGSTGVTGATGIMGVQGQTGDQGLPGEAGTEQGPTGPQGPQGPTGSAGPQGPTGPVGLAYARSIGNEVVSTTGKIWLDRNIGAIQVATTIDDWRAHGYLFQWGRAADGHEIRTNPETSVKSPMDAPNHNSFITTNSIPYDWRGPQNDNLWQPADDINNPCPAGFRVPTIAEWQNESDEWTPTGYNGAFASPLKLVRAGLRMNDVGNVYLADIAGYYWSSTILGNTARALSFSGTTVLTNGEKRATGCSIRCIKD